MSKRHILRKRKESLNICEYYSLIFEHLSLEGNYSFSLLDIRVSSRIFMKEISVNYTTAKLLFMMGSLSLTETRMNCVS